MRNGNYAEILALTLGVLAVITITALAFTQIVHEWHQLGPAAWAVLAAAVAPQAVLCSAAISILLWHKRGATLAEALDAASIVWELRPSGRVRTFAAGIILLLLSTGGLAAFGIIVTIDRTILSLRNKRTHCP